MTLQTRRPTGQPAFPLILVEGEEKAGKSFMVAQATASPRIGRSFVLDLGDGTMDEYASLGDYEILVHDGTWSSMIGQIREAAAAPRVDERPNFIGVDAGTLLWGLQKDRASQRARGSKRARQILADDPDADIDVSMTYWNEAKDRWAELLRILRLFPGIAVITAQGREVTKVDSSGQPTREKEWSVEIEKTTPAAATAWIRLRRPHVATLVGIRRLGVEIPPQGLRLPDEHVIDHVVFEILGAGSGFVARATPEPTLGIPRAEAKTRLVAAVRSEFPTMTDGERQAEARRLWNAQGLGEKEELTPSELADLLAQVGAPPDAGPVRPQEPQGPPDGPTPSTEPQGPPAEPTGPDPAVLTPRAISDMRKPDVVRHLTDLGLPTNGPVGELRARLIAAVADFDLADHPSALDPEVAQGSPHDAAQALADAFPGAVIDGGGLEPSTAEVLEGEQDLPEVDDVPEGWTEATCICGEPIMYEHGNYAATVRHLDPKLDVEHKADEPF